MKPLLFTLLLAWLPGLAAAAPVTPLGAGDMPALLAPPRQGERIIALWSLDCAYCEANLAALSRLQKSHPQAVELVVVSTDGPARRQAVATRLQAMNMADKTTYFYAEPTPERLNYLLDPGWGGELPRTLVIHADGSRTGISGELTAAQLRRIMP